MRSDRTLPLDGGRHERPGLEQLLEQVARGDRPAFEQVYDMVSGPVYGLALRVLRDPAQAEEIAQEVLVEVWRSAARFDAARGSAMSWVMTIAHHRAVDRVRAAQAATDRETRVARLEVHRPYDDVAEAVETSMEWERLRRCLGSLTELQRESVTYAYYGGYSYREVSELLRVPLATVKTRMRDGLIRMRDCLGVGR